VRERVWSAYARALCWQAKEQLMLLEERARADEADRAKAFGKRLEAVHTSRDYLALQSEQQAPRIGRSHRLVVLFRESTSTALRPTVQPPTATRTRPVHVPSTLIHAVPPSTVGEVARTRAQAVELRDLRATEFARSAEFERKLRQEAELR
jgi:hypothetical protein